MSEIIAEVGQPLTSDQYLIFKSSDVSLEGINGVWMSDAAFVITAYADSLPDSSKHYLLKSDPVSIKEIF